MSAAEALMAARDAGVRVAIDGHDLLLEARVELPAIVIDLVKKNKTEILALLRRPVDGDWSASDWQAFFDERAGVAERQRGLTRDEAEQHALEACVIEWLTRSHQPSPQDRCVACGGKELKGAPVIPFGTARRGHAWLHADCWPAWRSARQASAIDALAALGIGPQASGGR